MVIGDTSDLAGSAVASAGDLDGDGAAEVMVGGPGRGAGHAWLWRGGSGGAVDIGRADLQITGVTGGDEAGAAVVGFGDADGDGVPDIAIGAPSAGSGATGAAYVISGAGLL